MNILGKLLTLAKFPVGQTLSWITSPRTAYIIGEPFFWLLGLRSKRREVDLSQVKRVLVVRLDEIGDVVMTTPFLRELRRNLPYAWITLVVKPPVYNIMELCPYINEVITFNWKVSGQCQNQRRHWRALRLAYCSLWRQQFDLAILPRWDADHYHGTFVLYFSGAPWRVGYSENVIAQKKRINDGFDRLLTHTQEDTSLKHEVEHNLEVIRFLSGEVKDDRLELWIDKEDEEFVDNIFKNHGVESNDMLVTLCPGAGAPKREWPLSSYAELGLWLQKECRAHLIIVGGPGEELLGQEIQCELGPSVINVIGKTTLRQTAAFLKQSALYIGSDSGSMHIAAAMDVPVVELSCHPASGTLFSSNSPLRFGPWNVHHTIVQPKSPIDPCVNECIADNPHCILKITIEEVKEAIAKQLLYKNTIRSHKNFRQLDKELIIN